MPIDLRHLFHSILALSALIYSTGAFEIPNVVIENPSVPQAKTGGVTELNMQNLEMVLKSAQVVFVAFCADWCPFSRKLKPNFMQAAQTWQQENPTASVVWAMVDSVAQSDVADKYYVNKYPTMKVFINGELITKEYRGSREPSALMDFVKKQLEISINEFPNADTLARTMNKDKRNVIGYFHCRDCDAYQNFQKVASLLREDCAFWSGQDEALKAMNENMMVFRDPGTEDEQKFSGKFEDYDFLKSWLTDKCIPLVREVTFENVEGLTEEGMPFLIYFRDPNNKDGDKTFAEMVARELYDQKGAINALLADGHKFAHPLKHLGKSAKDLPVLAIDSFQHMFLFDDMSQLTVPGKLRQFVLDLHSGKLHKDFHETLDARIADLQRTAMEQLKQAEAEHGAHGEHDDNGLPKPPSIPKIETTPPPSIFKELKPSGKRYSLLKKTEL